MLQGDHLVDNESNRTDVSSVDGSAPGQRKRLSLANGIAIGVAIGAALGVALNNIGVGIGLGIGIGIAMSLAAGERRGRV